MSLERYYKILGVQPTSSQDEIRRKYRKLVMRYHPDKNPSPKAAQQFLQIKEAYEIVSGKIRPPLPTRTRTQRNPSASKATAPRKPEYTNAQREKMARQRLKDQELRDKIENDRYFKRLTSGRRWKIMRIAAFVGAIVSVLTILDRFLPRHYTEDRTTHFQLSRAASLGGESLSLIKTKRKQFYWISGGDYFIYSKAPDIYIEESWIFHDPVQILSRDKTKYHYYSIYYTFYRHYGILLFFLLPIFTIWYKRKTVLFTVVFLTSYYGSIPLLLLYVLSGDRWAHFLTLGFF